MAIKGVYCITNTVNLKKYIGSSIDIKSRLRQHKSDLKRQRHPNAHLQRSFNRYGMENFTFEIIYVADQDIEDAELRRIEGVICEKYQTYHKDKGYNLVKELGDSRELTEEGRARHKASKRKTHAKKALVIDINSLDAISFDAAVDACKYLNCPPARFTHKLVVDGYLHIYEDDLSEIEDLKAFIRDQILKSKTPTGTPVPVLDTQTGVYYETLREFTKLYGIPKYCFQGYNAYKHFVICREGVTDPYYEVTKDYYRRKLGQNFYKASISILDLETGVYYYGYRDAAEVFGVSVSKAPRYFNNNEKFSVEKIK